MVGAATCAPAPRSVTAVRARPAARGRGSVVVKAEERGVAQRLEDVKRRVREALPDVEAAGSAPRFTTSRSSGWNVGTSADQLRKQERQVLEAWTQERLMQLAAGGTMLLVLALLLSAGGPPADPRCTLPWC